MEFKNIFYYFCCCFSSEPDKQEKQDNYITYNDIKLLEFLYIFLWNE